jgi:hypothetical protein
MTGTRDDFSGDCRGNDMYWTDGQLKEGSYELDCNNLTYWKSGTTIRTELIKEEKEGLYLQDYVFQII